MSNNGNDDGRIIWQPLETPTSQTSSRSATGRRDANFDDPRSRTSASSGTLSYDNFNDGRHHRQRHHHQSQPQPQRSAPPVVHGLQRPGPMKGYAPDSSAFPTPPVPTQLTGPAALHHGAPGPRQREEHPAAASVSAAAPPSLRRPTPASDRLVRQPELSPWPLRACANATRLAVSLAIIVHSRFNSHASSPSPLDLVQRE